ncbi:MAG: hypothetical protein AABY22_36075 [Nanoarchaeota archaeon]
MENNQILQVPKFESNIPIHLLKDSTDKDKYILEALSKLTNQGDWQNETLCQIHDLSAKTNGRVTRIEEWKTEIHVRLKKVEFIRKMLISKYFWFGLAVFLFLLYPWILNRPTSQLFEIIKRSLF